MNARSGLLILALIAAVSARPSGTAPGDPLLIQAQGSFAVGGTVVDSPDLLSAFLHKKGLD